MLVESSKNRLLISIERADESGRIRLIEKLKVIGVIMVYACE